MELHDDMQSSNKLTCRQQTAAVSEGAAKVTGAGAGGEVPFLFAGLAADVSKNSDYEWAKNYFASPAAFGTFSVLEYAKATCVALNAILKGKITGDEALVCLNGILAGTGGLLAALGLKGAPTCFALAFVTGFVGDVNKFIAAYHKGEKLEMAKQTTFAVADLGCAAMVGLGLGIFAELGAVPLLVAAGASAVKGLWNGFDTVKSVGKSIGQRFGFFKEKEGEKAPLLPTAATPDVQVTAPVSTLQQ